VNSEQALVHICSRDDWNEALGSGRRIPESFGADGFIHLSTPAQVHLPANRLFAGRSDLVILWLDPTALGSPVLWEPGVPTDPSSMLFPHLYGPLPLVAVTSIEDYRPGADGRFPALV
jgi:uncharacterized protein (DUF952 family)